MSLNYDGSQVGVPYVRAPRITINYAADRRTTATIEQALAVKLADGTVRNIEPLPPITCELDFAADGDTPVPMISPDNAAPLGTDTTLNQAFLAVLAIVHDRQIKAEQA